MWGSQCGRAVERLCILESNTKHNDLASFEVWIGRTVCFFSSVPIPPGNHIHLRLCVKEILEALHELHRRDSHLSFQAQQREQVFSYLCFLSWLFGSVWITELLQPSGGTRFFEIFRAAAFLLVDKWIVYWILGWKNCSVKIGEHRYVQVCLPGCLFCTCTEQLWGNFASAGD